VGRSNWGTVVALTVAALVVTTLPLPSAPADWSPPHSVDRTWDFQGEPRVVTTRSGSAVLMWTARDPNQDARRGRLRRIMPDGTRSKVRTVTPASQFINAPALGVDDDGDVVLAWQIYDPAYEKDQVFARRLSRAGKLGPVRRLSSPSVNATRPTVAVNPRGKAEIAFYTGLRASKYVVRRIRIDSSLGPVRRLGTATFGGPALVASRTGEFIAAGFRRGAIQVTRIAPDGTRRTRNLTGALSDDDAMGSVSVDRDGDVRLVFRSYNEGFDARVWRSNGTLSRIKRVIPPRPRPIIATHVTDLQGDSMLTWTRHTDPSDVVLRARVWRRDGTLGRIRKLGAISDPGQYGDVTPQGHLALDDDGNGVIVWNREPEYETFTVWARAIHRDGTLGRAVRIRRNSGYGDLAMSPRGRAKLLIGGDEGLLYRTGP
jgi:hypothetical protein